MTASWKCDICGKITSNFRYNNPRKDPNNIDDGQWLCEEHDKQAAKDHMLEVEKRGGLSERAVQREKLKKRKKLW